VRLQPPLGLCSATLNNVPELPEVETIRRQLDPLLRDCSVQQVWAFDSPKFTSAHQALGSRLQGVRRRGKYLLIDLDPAPDPSPAPALAPAPAQHPDRNHVVESSPGVAARELIVHLGMTGRLSVSSTGSEHPSTTVSSLTSWEQSTRVESSSSQRHLRAVWVLDDGRSLFFDDVRRFGRIAVVAAGEHQSLATLAALGPEPFDDDFTADYLRQQINSTKRSVKAQLLSQRVVAGLGNIYVDEALWRAQVHPAAKRITKVQSMKLRRDIQEVIAVAINNGGTTLRNYRDAEGSAGSNQHHLQCYGRAGQDCLRCGTTLRRILIDARATVFCPRCQRR